MSDADAKQGSHLAIWDRIDDSGCGLHAIRRRLAALREDRTLTDLAKQFGLHPNQITEWRRQLLENAASAFGGGAAAVEPVDLPPLHAKIGRQALELVFFKRRAHQGGIAERKACVASGTARSTLRNCHKQPDDSGVIQFTEAPSRSSR